MPTAADGAGFAPWRLVPSWKPVDIPAAKLALPVPEKLAAVVEQLDVERSPRYVRGHQGGRETYCNVYAWDVTRAMGCEVPHWVDGRGLPTAPNPKLGRELDANGVVRWLATTGASRGWVGADKQTALSAANRGHVVVLGWDGGRHIGHVAVMLTDGSISQAGVRNLKRATLQQTFGALPARFWIQSTHRNSEAAP